jgi:hypothetical protein
VWRIAIRSPTPKVGTLASAIPASHLLREMIDIGEGRRGGGLDISVDQRV